MILGCTDEMMPSAPILTPPILTVPMANIWSQQPRQPKRSRASFQRGKMEAILSVVLALCGGAAARRGPRLLVEVDICLRKGLACSDGRRCGPATQGGLARR